MTYPCVSVDGVITRKHRAVWEEAHGPIPKGMVVDHINGDIQDNRLENLRCVTNSRNLHNTKAYKGFSFHKASGKWDARIMVDRKLHWLGLHDTAVDARAAYLRKYNELLGENFNGRV